MKFKRYPAHRQKRLGSAWRRPRGWQNKLRLEKKGHGKRVKVGYRTQASTRGQKAGKEVAMVYNLTDVAAVQAGQGIVIGNIGMRKKIDVLKAIISAKLHLLTGDASAELKELQERFASRKKETTEREKEKEAKQKELEKKATKKEEKDTNAQSDLESAAEKAAPAKKSPAKKAAKTKTQDDESDEKKTAEDKEKEKVLTKAR